MMKRVYSILFLFVITLFFFSCQNTVEVIEEVYEDDTPRLVRIYKKNDKASPLKEMAYYTDGTLQLEGAYRDKKRHGVWTFYYDNGNKWSQAVYKEGINNGKATTWFENGNKRYEGRYKNGEKTGTWKFWNEQGELEKEIQY